MDIGKFKASGARLTLWVLIPPVLIVGVGMSTFALKARSDWGLRRAKALAEALPALASARRDAEAVVKDFKGAEAVSLKSEEELISYLQSAATKVGFTVDSLKVERLVSPFDKNVPMLVGHVQGIGTFIDIENYLGEVTTGQPLLSESALRLSRTADAARSDECRVDISFELTLFNAIKSSGGGL